MTSSGEQSSSVTIARSVDQPIKQLEPTANTFDSPISNVDDAQDQLGEEQQQKTSIEEEESKTSNEAEEQRSLNYAEVQKDSNKEGNNSPSEANRTANVESSYNMIFK